MPLWRVDVGGVSHRYVDAPTRADAVREVEVSLLRAIGVHASPAHHQLARIYEGLGPIQRKNMLAKIDGLTNPRERNSARSAQRQLERLIARNQEEEQWARSALAGAPPISPATADELARLAEVRHVEGLFTRPPEWDRRPPLHGQE
jgi:hypothetical protein